MSAFFARVDNLEPSAVFLAAVATVLIFVVEAWATLLYTAWLRERRDREEK